MNARIMLRAAVTAVVALHLGQSAAWALDANQTALLRDATSQLTQAQTNLKLAQDSAGPAAQAIPAARGRLAASRLSSAKDSLAQAEARLARLPGEDAEVKAFKSKYDGVAGEIAALEVRLAAPAPAPGVATPAPAQPGANPAPAAPAAAGVRLNYQQETLLKDANFYLNEVVGRAEAVAKVAADAAKVADKQTLDHRLINDAMTSITTANGRVENINTRVAQLPATGAGVPELVASLKKQVDSIAASTAVLKPVHEMFTKALDPKTYPEMDADVKRLGELAQMFNDPQIFQRDMVKSAVIYTQLSPANDEAARIAKKYALLVTQKTDQGIRIESTGKNFTAQHGTFSAEAKRVGEQLPKAIDDNIAKIDQMTKEAVDEKKPAFFPNGIADQIVYVKAKLALLEVLVPAQAKANADKIAKAVDRVKAAQGSLSEAIIQANELPPDRYRGSDRAALIQQATALWKKEDPSATILTARIPSQEWSRNTYWRYQSSAWYKSDQSSLQVQLIVKRDDKIAEIRPINLTKDHMQNDQVSGGALFPKSETLGPSSLMSAAKAK